jgi:hypothetical protein
MMVKKRGTNAVKRSKVKSLKTKAMSAKQTKNVKGGAVDAFIRFNSPGSGLEWSGPGDEGPEERKI